MLADVYHLETDITSEDCWTALTPEVAYQLEQLGYTEGVLASHAEMCWTEMPTVAFLLETETGLSLPDSDTTLFATLCDRARYKVPREHR